MCLRLMGGAQSVGGVAFITLTTLAVATYDSNPGFRIGKSVSKTSKGVLCLRTSNLRKVTTLSSIGLGKRKTFDFGRPHPRSPRFCHLQVSSGIVGFSISSVRALRVGTPCMSFSATCAVRNSKGDGGVGRLALGRVTLRGGISSLLTALHGGGVDRSVFRSDLTALLGGCGRSIGMGCVFTTPGATTTCFTLFRGLGGCLVFSPLGGGSSIGYFTTMTADLGGACPSTMHSGGLCGVIVGNVGGAHRPRTGTLRVPRRGVMRANVVSVTLHSVRKGIHGLASLGNGIMLLSFSMFRSPTNTPRGVLLHRLCGGCTSRKLRVCRVSLSTSRRC